MGLCVHVLMGEKGVRFKDNTVVSVHSLQRLVPRFESSFQVI